MGPIKLYSQRCIDYSPPLDHSPQSGVVSIAKPIRHTNRDPGRDYPGRKQLLWQQRVIIGTNYKNTTFINF